MPDARSALSAALGPDGRIYVMGGTDFSGTVFYTIEAYDPSTNGQELDTIDTYRPAFSTWATPTQIPNANDGQFSAIGSDGRIYLKGESACYLPDSMARRRWSPTPIGRCYRSMP